MAQPNITKDITISRSAVKTRVGSILNMIAKARFDGTNARYTNHLPPKIDFEQEAGLINDIIKDSMSRLLKRIKCYVVSSETDTTGTEPTYTIHLSFPYNWASQEEGVLEDKIGEYLAYQVIALWFETVSPQDIPYYAAKAQDLLHEVRHTCELRNNVIHTLRDTIY